jgi:hypothetical protein
MLAIEILIFALLAIIPLAASGALMIRAVRQSSRGPPQWAGNPSSPAVRCEKAAGHAGKTFSGERCGAPLATDRRAP